MLFLLQAALGRAEPDLAEGMRRRTSANCGKLRHEPNGAPAGWTSCYVDGRDAAWPPADMRCRDIVKQGNMCNGAKVKDFGCWHGKTGSSPGAANAGNNMVKMSCRGGIQHTTTRLGTSGWAVATTTFGVCVQCDKAAPVNCELSKWTKWGDCSKKCGGGKQKRLRHIKKAAKHGGTCTGELEESKDCNIRACTQHDAVVEHVDVVERMIDAVAKSHSGMDKSVAEVSKHSKAVAAVKTKAIADLTAIRDKLTVMKGKLNDKKTKLGKEDATITEALAELKARWTKLNSQQAEKLKNAEEKRAAHEKKIKTMLSNMERRRRNIQLARAM